MISRGEIGVVLVAAFVAAIIAFMVTSRLPSSFEGRATLLVGSGSGQYTDLLAAQILTQIYAQLAVTGPVLESALERADLTEQVDTLDLRVRAVPIRDSLTVTIIGEASDPVAAAAVANAVAAELDQVGLTEDARFDAERQSMLDGLDTIAQQIGTVRAEIDELEAIDERSVSEESRFRDARDRLPTLLVSQSTLLREARQLDVDAVRVVDPARSTDQPVSPNPLLNTVLAFVTGLAVGAGFVAVSRAFAPADATALVRAEATVTR